MSKIHEMYLRHCRPANGLLPTQFTVVSSSVSSSGVGSLTPTHPETAGRLSVCLSNATCACIERVKRRVELLYVLCRSRGVKV